jgi:1,4-alpha-glucan branching enzyme
LGTTGEVLASKPTGIPANAPVRKATLAPAEIERIVRAEHADPFTVLGPHPVSVDGVTSIAIRAFQPNAETITVLWGPGAREIPARRIHDDGLFEALVPAPAAGAGDSIPPGTYRLRTVEKDGRTVEGFDAYAFPPLLTDFDLYLMGEGTHYLKYEKLGAHIREVSGAPGVHFGVWAPNAQRVSVVGDFNRWDGRVNPMRNRGTTGVWEIFLPGLGQGQIYKFEILSQINRHLELKSDPYGVAAELRPANGSVVFDIEHYTWNDAPWIEARTKADHFSEPMSIYEVHLGSWRKPAESGKAWLTYRELGDQLLPYAKDMGFTHIELMPIMEHPFDGSWGYQTVGYFSVTSRYGSPTEFMEFIDRCHQAGIGVLLDWTPAHFPRDAHGLAFFDGTHLYEHADPRRGSQPDWGTLVFNYGRSEVQNFLISNALFWMDKYHLDGLRVDAVASMLYLDYSRKAGEWIPNQFGGRENLEAIAFLKRLNEVIHARFPGIMTIAEESTSYPAVSRPTYVGGLGFDLKWNMGWMNDTLKYFQTDPIYRKFHHNQLTFSMIYAFTENFVLPLSHDEVVHGKRSLLSKMPGDNWQKFANLRLLYAYFFAHPGKKLLFMGADLAQWREWQEYTDLDWALMEFPTHRGLHRLMSDLNKTYSREPALYQVEFDWQGFEWINADDGDMSVVTFLRRARDPGDFIVVACNLTPVIRENYRVGVPEPGFYREIMNSDSAYYEGTDVGNNGGLNAEPIPWDGRPYSLNVKLPPLAGLYFKK